MSSSAPASAGSCLSRLQTVEASRDALLCTGCSSLEGFILLLTNSSVAAASDPMNLHARAPGCAGCRSLELQQHSNISPILSEHPLLQHRVMVCPWLISIKLEIVPYREVMKNVTPKASKIPVSLFKRLLQAEKMVAHENRPVTESHILLNVSVCKIQG